MLIKMAGLIPFVFICMLVGTGHAKGKITQCEIAVDGMQRSYIVYQPFTSDKNPLPLMIVLHGGLGNAEHIMKTSGMNDIADSGPFVVVYPNGIGGRFGFKNRRTWNAGGCCGLADRKSVDDVKFIDKIIGGVSQKISIDTRRVYVTGMSNGAMMAYRLAAEIPGKIAAVIAVSGALTVDDVDSARDIPVMIIHGTEDENIPIRGGIGANSLAGVSYRSLSDAVTLIIRSRQCLAPEESQQSGIRISSYRCRSGAPVVIVLIEGGAHAWPGGQGGWRTDSGGPHFSASKEAWEFAKQFSKTSK